MKKNYLVRNIHVLNDERVITKVPVWRMLSNESDFRFTMARGLLVEHIFRFYSVFVVILVIMNFNNKKNTKVTMQKQREHQE